MSSAFLRTIRVRLSESVQPLYMFICNRTSVNFTQVSTYLNHSQAAIVVYDLTNADTFSRAKTWVKELQRQASPNIVIALAGNKADLASKRAVETAEAQVGSSLQSSLDGGRCCQAVHMRSEWNETLSTSELAFGID